MNPPIILSSNRLRCEIKPELGGCIAGLWLGEIPVLRSTPASELLTVRQASRDFVAIEPVSHVNNAINRMQADPDDLGIRVLQAGESMSVQMSIQVEEV